MVSRDDGVRVSVRHDHDWAYGVAIGLTGDQLADFVLVGRVNLGTSTDQWIIKSERGPFCHRCERDWGSQEPDLGCPGDVIDRNSNGDPISWRSLPNP